MHRRGEQATRTRKLIKYRIYFRRKKSFGVVHYYAANPFFPADISALLNEIPGPRALVTTPVHLRALITSNTDLPELELIVCAHAPLSRELALQAVERFGAPLQ